MAVESLWLAVGFLGQAFFSMRFICQWLYSEYLKRSVIPRAFWYFSLLGGVTLLIYAIYREDPVFIVGQGFGLLVYSRNLLLIYREHRSEKEEKESRA